MNEKNTLYIVVPCYKEQEVLPETSRRLREKMRQLMDAGKISRRSRVMFVNDGSSDNTWAIISELHEKEPEMFSGVNLSRNRGHQNALLAGLLTAVNDADMIVSMDADLQDDINAVDEMVDDYHKGYDVVYGVRSKRETDTFFKRFTAEGFYKVMKALGVDIVFNHADYRLMSKRAVEGLAQFTEVNLFLRGIVPQIGYKWTTVTYERAERFAGESKYPPPYPNLSPFMLQERQGISARWMAFGEIFSQPSFGSKIPYFPGSKSSKERILYTSIMPLLIHFGTPTCFPLFRRSSSTGLVLISSSVPTTQKTVSAFWYTSQEVMALKMAVSLERQVSGSRAFLFSFNIFRSSFFCKSNGLFIVGFLSE